MTSTVTQTKMDVETFDKPTSITLSPSQSFAATRSPVASTSVAADSYVLHITALSNSYAAALSAPSNSIATLDKSSLRPLGSFQAHSDALTLIRSTSLLYNGANSANVLLSSGKDGFVKVWDERKGADSVLKCPYTLPFYTASTSLILTDNPTFLPLIDLSRDYTSFNERPTGDPQF